MRCVDDDDFDRFVLDAEQRLRRALVGSVGVALLDDAIGEALSYLAEHRERVLAMENPVGYLFRVGQTRVEKPRRPALPAVEPARLPEIEPGLAPALMSLPDSQRTCVWLAHACGWSHSEIADALGIAPSTVATHVGRGLAHLRRALGVR